MSPRWNRIVDSSGLQPKPRHGHRAVPIKELIVIFGGGNEGMISDLIAFNTQTNHWFKPSVKGTIPAGRASYGVTIVDKTRIIMFGGMLEFMECTDEVFELQASRWEWTKLNPHPPPDLKPPPLPRLGHSFTSIGDKVYLFGGLTLDNDRTEQTNFYPRYLNDFYTLEWSENTLLWNIPVTYGNTPSPRESHSAVAHTDCNGNQKLIIYGGMSGRRLGDLWIFNVNTMTWSEVETSGITPLPRSIHSATLVGDKMYVFGGWVPLTSADLRTNVLEKEWKVTNQLLCLDLSGMVWKDMTNLLLPNDMPKARAGHAAAEINGRIYIWSGRDGYRRAWNNQVCCNDLWFLDVDKPPIMPKPQLLKGDLNYLDINWSTVPRAEFYILQIQKFDISHTAINNFEKNPSNFYLPKSSHLGEFSNHKPLPNINMLSANDSEKNENHYLVKSSLASLPHLTSPGNEIQPLSPHSPLPKLQILATKSQPVIRKSTSYESPSALPKTAFTYAVSKVANFSNQIPLLRPITIPMSKATNVKGTAEIGQKSFAVTRTTNLVRLNAPLPQVLKPQTFIVKNSGFKLVAVNKDSQIKLVPSQCSHVVNKQNTTTPEKVINKLEERLSPTIKEHSSESCTPVSKKAKLSIKSETESSASQNISDSSFPKSLATTPTKMEPSDSQLKPPSFPEKVQIKRCSSTEGIFLSWTPPPGDIVSTYKVTLCVKGSPNSQKLIYNGVRPECYILKSHLDSAHIDESGGTRTMKFTISARNSKGVGPALVVKWVLHPSHVQNN